MIKLKHIIELFNAMFQLFYFRIIYLFHRNFSWAPVDQQRKCSHVSMKQYFIANILNHCILISRLVSFGVMSKV